MALSMVKGILDERNKPAEILELVFPMTKDELNNRKLWVESAAIVAAKAKKGTSHSSHLATPCSTALFCTSMNA
jgi:precorrin-2 methylase